MDQEATTILVTRVVKSSTLEAHRGQVQKINTRSQSLQADSSTVP